MKAFWIALFLTLSLLQAGERVTGLYRITYGLFGQIGLSRSSLIRQGDHYHVEIRAEATGIAKVMSGGRVESYASYGVIKKGKLIPQRFVIRTKKGKHFFEEHRFVFDHLARKVRDYHRVKTDEGEVTHETTLPFYAPDDILTLFFNLPFYLKQSCKAQKRCLLYAVGANDKNGLVTITPLGNRRFRVVLHRRIFASKEGEMFIHLTKEGLCDRALLKDVVFFGDVKAKAITIESSEKSDLRTTSVAEGAKSGTDFGDPP